MSHVGIVFPEGANVDNGRWNVWEGDDGQYFCFRSILPGTRDSGAVRFWPGPTMDDTADLGSCITMCDVLNARDSQ